MTDSALIHPVPFTGITSELAPDQWKPNVWLVGTKRYWIANKEVSKAEFEVAVKGRDYVEIKR